MHACLDRNVLYAFAFLYALTIFHLIFTILGQCRKYYEDI